MEESNDTASKGFFLTAQANLQYHGGLRHQLVGDPPGPCVMKYGRQDGAGGRQMLHRINLLAERSTSAMGRTGMSALSEEDQWSVSLTKANGRHLLVAHPTQK